MSGDVVEVPESCGRRHHSILSPFDGRGRAVTGYPLNRAQPNCPLGGRLLVLTVSDRPLPARTVDYPTSPGSGGGFYSENLKVQIDVISVRGTEE